MSGRVDITELIALREKFKQIEDAKREAAIRDITNEAAARLLAKVRPRTPTGVYPAGSGKVGGTLKRGWALKNVSHEKINGGWKVNIINPVEYASYVEFGHRQKPGRFVPAIGKRLKKGWVEGKFMLKRSEEELETELPGIIKRKIEQLFDEALK